MPHLAHVTLVVPDYDAALAFYVGKLGFALVEDTPIGTKRWVTIRPLGTPASATTILLARAATAEQHAAVGNQTGGRVAFFLATDDFARDHAAFTLAGVRWERPPSREAYGIVAVFRDPFGNLWDLVEHTAPDPVPAR
ncbi:VOC family protein [Sphingomonas ginsenosidivorax]|uniref:VOC family protein n=1 Tax=Sphingomonas ginsenosidivorax TaxID=862135 RepID=A0A5C6UJC1_9SPHN|nr:VOC family protein [Sphingomonas ginsenosidivorax]TXC72534.1 VOC family protein [Sphingomonas ginsenosidivorax]